MRISIKYGCDEICLDIPDSANVCVPRPPASKGDEFDAHSVARALSDPVGSAPFGELFSRGDAVTIVVPDITRRSGAKLYLPPLLDQLGMAGIDDRDVTILFANGTHRAHTLKEQESIAGPEIFRRINCVDHDARSGDLAGVDVDGIGNVRLNRLVTDCDKLVITGAIGVHYLAGFGGGRKSIMPGTASFEDAAAFHLLSLSRRGPGRHPMARAGNIDGNPMNDYAEKVLDAVNPTFGLNTIIDPDGRLVKVVAGEPGASFAEGVRAAYARSVVRVGGMADVAVVSCGGFPKDINFIQAHKAYEHASFAVKRGGKIFMAAQCGDGLGSDRFIEWFRFGNVESMEKKLRESFHINGQTAMATAIKSGHYETVLLSDLDKDVVTRMGIRPAESVESFLREAAEAVMAAESAMVIPEGGYVLPAPG